MDTHALVYVGFIVLPIVVAFLVWWGAGSRPLAVAILTWMILAAALGRSGLLGNFGKLPPPLGIFLLSGFVATAFVGKSGWVRRLVALPISTLIVAQSFRIIVEILIHLSSDIGLAPKQMTWSGYNFDIVTGATALALAPFAKVVPRSVVFLWNCLGLALLINVVGIAVVSFPTPFQLLRPDNTWVAFFPYVWLPTILVTAALLGHIVVFRNLAAGQVSTRTTSESRP